MKYIYMCLPIGLGVCMYHAFVMTLEEITGRRQA